MLPEQRWEEVKKASTYRELLKIYLSVFDFTLSDFARATGFGRGFPGDILSGKRRLTAKSSFRFEKALKLPAAGRKFFRLLVAKEESDLYPEIDRARVAFELEQLRTKPWKHSRKSAHEITSPRFQGPLLDKKVLTIYAAAGGPGNGATLSEIEERTGFSAEEVLKHSKELERLQLFEFKSETRVAPCELHFFLQTTDQSALLAHTFRQSAKLAVEKLLGQEDKKDEFFFNSSFCVRADKLPEFKKELRETVLKFIDNSIDDDGTRVVHLLTALHL
jgi:hypothetical protein